MFHEKLFFEGCRLCPALGAMKIESGMVFFTFWLSETYRGWYLTLFITFFRISIFSDILGVFLMPKFRLPGPSGGPWGTRFFFKPGPWSTLIFLHYVLFKEGVLLIQKVFC